MVEMINSIQVNALYETRWDDYVARHPAGNYCHLFRWRRIIEDTYGHSAIMLAAFRGEHGQANAARRLAGILPVVRIKRYVFKDELVSMPFLDLGGVLADDRAVERCLIEHALNLLQDRRIKTLELRQSVALTPEQKVSGSPPLQEDAATPPETLGPEIGQSGNLACRVMDEKVRLLLELPESSDALMKSFKSKLRSQIKRPMKEGLYCRVGQKELLDDFYDVFCVNMRELGSPVHAKELMENILREFGPQARVFVVYLDNRPLACSFAIGFNRLFSNPWASSLREYSRLAPNMLLYWTMLAYACDHQFRYFDFGRSTPNEGTYRFKAQWGATPLPLRWYCYGGATASTQTLKSKDGRKAAEYIWQKLPLKITNWIGPRIRRFVSL